MLLIYSDGACTNNGKANAEVCGSFAAYFVPTGTPCRCPGNEEVHYRLKGQRPIVHIHKAPIFVGKFERATNNLAEAKTLEMALTWAKSYSTDLITVCMDSKLVMYQIQGIYTTNNKALRRVYSSILDTIDQLPRVAFAWIPGDLMKQTIIAH